MKKPKHIKRIGLHIITEHIRVLRSIADEELSAKDTVKGERGRVIYNPFGLVNEQADPTGEKRRKLLELWPLESTYIRVAPEGEALLVYTEIV